MVGYVGDAVANALQKWPKLREANIFPIRATDGASVVVDTPLPAIAVHVMGDDGDGNVFLGGGIRQYFDLVLYVLLPVTNYSFSGDSGEQAKMLDLSDEVIRCMERTTELDALRTEHDLMLQYSEMPTETTYGTRGAMSVVIDVHKVIYKGSVAFDTQSDQRYDTVKDIEIKIEDVKT